MILKMDREDSNSRSLSDFSIEHILNRAGGERKNEDVQGEHSGRVDVSGAFDWLQCSRFCPPKVPRMTRRDAPQKRQLGRYPRIPFTNQQIATLEEKFQESPYLSSDEAASLSQKLHLADVKVKIWFQNRRARKRREELGVGRSADKGGKKGEKDAMDGASGLQAIWSPDQASTSSGFVACQAVPFVYLSPPSKILEFNPR
ncbi:unnamed protein product [Phaedon cochleariae]|uniref:Homeobox domain-containing protein n=1 Tax=Phaedon cochleariae TaxID=80249 RepID=A0A9P0DGJ0_PHACE|nr:unnamed protein product [Phaedon cochleariae]